MHNAQTDSQSIQCALSKTSFLRVLILATFFMFVSMLWVRKASLIAFTILVAEGSPPIPGVAALLLLSALSFLLGQRQAQRKEDKPQSSLKWLRDEALLIYIIMSLALVTLEANGVRQLLAQITVLRYFAAPGNDYAFFAELLPRWMTPPEEIIIREFYEGSPTGAVPWRAWALPLFLWGLLFMSLGLSLVCLNVLFRRPWAEHERLTYPLAELILQLAPEETPFVGRGFWQKLPESASSISLLRQPLFWLGVGMAAIYDGSNIAHAFSPQIVAIGQQFDLNKLLTERPWSYLRPITLTYRPEIIGLGYLVPTDVLFSVWSFFLLFRVENFIASLAGYQIANFPFERAQGMGAYLGLMIFLVWAARRHLWQIVQMAMGGPPAAWDCQELLPSRVAFWGFIGGWAGFCVFCRAAGVSPGLTLCYSALLYGACLVYIRIRAQTGLPINYMVPREELTESILALRPTSGHLDKDALKSETAFAVISVLSRMTFPQLGAFEMEGIQLGKRAGLPRKPLLICLAYGLALGLILGLWMHLSAYYNFGANILDGGTTAGGYRTAQARIAFDRLQTRVFTAVPLDMRTNIARGIGFLMTILLLGLRLKFLRFPLNPFGLGISGSYGHSIWFPAFLAWLAKTLILHLGGPHTYKLALPIFLGLAIGHIMIAGGIWGLVGAFSEEVAKRYLLWFA